MIRDYVLYLLFHVHLIITLNVNIFFINKKKYELKMLKKKFKKEIKYIR